DQRQDGVADVEHRAAGLLGEVADGAATVEGHDELPELAVDRQLGDAQVLVEPDSAFERRDHGLDLAPFPDQAAELVDRDLELDRLGTLPRRLLEPEAERSVLGALYCETDVDDASQQRGSVRDGLSGVARLRDRKRGV